MLKELEDYRNIMAHIDGKTTIEYFITVCFIRMMEAATMDWMEQEQERPAAITDKRINRAKLLRLRKVLDGKPALIL